MKSQQLVIPFPDYPIKQPKAPRQKKPKKPSWRDWEFTPDPKFAVSEIDLIYKSKSDLRTHPHLTSSDNAAAFFRGNFDPGKIELAEEFHVAYLNRKHIVLAEFKHAVGGITAVIVPTQQVIFTALRLNATSFIACHNHPSGNTDPSVADMELTRKMAFAANLFDITMVDHIILTKHDHSSLADRGEMPTIH